MADVLSQKTVKTRKEHECFGCGRKFEKGSLLSRVTCVGEGQITTSYWCDTCNEYWNEHMDAEDLIGFGELKSCDEETWESIREKVEAVV